MSFEPIVLLATSEMVDLARRICQRLNDGAGTRGRFCLVEVWETHFANGEIKTKIPETIRRKEVYFLTSLQTPDPNTAVMRCLMTLDAISRASASSITLVTPFMSYTRQDRKDEPRVPITARLLADLIQVNRKVERVLTVDLHADQIQGFYTIPVDNLYGALVHRDYFRKKHQGLRNRMVVVSPDLGGVVRARRFARMLDPEIPVYSIDKRRPRPNQVEVMNFVGGSVEGKEVIIYDDMIDTGGSIIAAANEIRERGATSVTAVASHAIFSSKSGVPAEKAFADSGIQVVVTESIPRDEKYRIEHQDWLTVLPLDYLLGEAIHEASIGNGSISRLFEK